MALSKFNNGTSKVRSSAKVELAISSVCSQGDMTVKSWKSCHGPASCSTKLLGAGMEVELPLITGASLGDSMCGNGGNNVSNPASPLPVSRPDPRLEGKPSCSPVWVPLTVLCTKSPGKIQLASAETMHGVVL